MANIFDLPPEEAHMPFSILDTDLYKAGDNQHPPNPS